MAWDALFQAVENRFISVVADVDGVPTRYENQSPETIDVGGPPEDTGAGLWRSVHWTLGETEQESRCREFTAVRMVVMIAAPKGSGIAPPLANAQSMRSELRSSMESSPIAGVHFEGTHIENVGMNAAGFYQINFVMRLTFEEAVA